MWMAPTTRRMSCVQPPTSNSGLSSITDLCQPQLNGHHVRVTLHTPVKVRGAYLRN
jgi:hypothetical protein